MSSPHFSSALFHLWFMCLFPKECKLYIKRILFGCCHEILVPFSFFKLKKNQFGFCTYVDIWRISDVFIHHSPLHFFFFLRKGITLNLVLLDSTKLSGEQSQGPSYRCFPSVRVTGGHYHTDFYLMLEVEIRSSSLYSNTRLPKPSPQLFVWLF